MGYMWDARRSEAREGFKARSTGNVGCEMSGCDVVGPTTGALILQRGIDTHLDIPSRLMPTGEEAKEVRSDDDRALCTHWL